ncbi:unnamed protein product [Pleuronectes platessa]|uniref:Uncharacterized protein n=1 Tax=Pleuronectes platessa TaxID=8262 RepID=A0A9N7U8Z3_PLEPL|nr:unnamed protein product [Pleuronectes platessa]
MCAKLGSRLLLDRGAVLCGLSLNGAVLLVCVVRRRRQGGRAEGETGEGRGEEPHRRADQGDVTPLLCNKNFVFLSAPCVLSVHVCVCSSSSPETSRSCFTVTHSSSSTGGGGVVMLGRTPSQQRGWGPGGDVLPRAEGVWQKTDRRTWSGDDGLFTGELLT